MIACYYIDEGDDLMNKKTLIIISIIFAIIIPLICILVFQFSKEGNNENIIDENKIYSSENTVLQENNVLDNIVATDIETEDKTDTVELTEDKTKEKETEEKIENKIDTKEKNETIIETKDNNKNKDTKDEVKKEQVITNDKTESKPQTVENTEDKSVIEKNENTQEEQKTTTETVQTNTNTEVKEEEKKKIDLSKYDYYEESLNGTYKAFIKDTADMSVLKSLINECITEFGYTGVKVLQDESLQRSGVAYFTTNKYNVENLVYDTEGFTIYYYSVKEYHISTDGTATYFQTRSYIKVR